MSAAYGTKAHITYLPGEPFFWLKFPKFNEWAVEDLKSWIPARARSWDAAGKRWLIEREWTDVAISIMELAFDGVEIENEESQWSGSKPTPIRQTDQDFAALYLTPNAPAEVIRAVYKTLAKLHHPDKGGATARMQEVNTAFEHLRNRGAA